MDAKERVKNGSRHLSGTDRFADRSWDSQRFGIFGLCGKCVGKVNVRFWNSFRNFATDYCEDVSSSAALGLLLDIFKQYGTDSRAGFMGAVILSSTESLFYCMSVYFAAVKIEKTRYTLPGALLATLAGTVTAIVLTGMYI